MEPDRPHYAPHPLRLSVSTHVLPDASRRLLSACRGDMDHQLRLPGGRVGACRRWRSCPDGEGTGVDTEFGAPRNRTFHSSPSDQPPGRAAGAHGSSMGEASSLDVAPNQPAASASVIPPAGQATCPGPRRTRPLSPARSRGCLAHAATAHVSNARGTTEMASMAMMATIWNVTDVCGRRSGETTPCFPSSHPFCSEIIAINIVNSLAPLLA